MIQPPIEYWYVPKILKPYMRLEIAHIIYFAKTSDIPNS